jgi:hypothetical protein
MIPTVFKDFFGKLVKATEAGLVSWATADDTTYFCNQKNHSIYIYNRFDVDRELAYFGFRIETDGKSTPFTVYDHEVSDYAEMRILYEAAIANANNVEDDLNDFFS